MSGINNAPASPGANPRAAQVNIKFQSAARCGGQRAHDLRKGPQPSYVDATRATENRVLIEPVSGAELRHICEDRRARRQTKRAMKSNVSVGIAGVISFGIEAQAMFGKLNEAQQDAAFLEVAQALADLLETDVTGLVVHCDETAIHAHFQCPAFNRSGHHVSDVAKRGKMREMQDITARVMQTYAPDIERGTSRAVRMKAGETYAETMHKNVNRLHYEIPLELADLEAKVLATKKKVEENEARAERARKKAERLEAEAKSSEAAIEKALKNAEIYERRALKAKEAEQLAQAEYDRKLRLLNEKKDELSEVETALAQKKTKIASLRAKRNSLQQTLTDSKTTLAALSA